MGGWAAIERGLLDRELEGALLTLLSSLDDSSYAAWTRRISADKLLISRLFSLSLPRVRQVMGYRPPNPPLPFPFQYPPIQTPIPASPQIFPFQAHQMPPFVDAFPPHALFSHTLSSSLSLSPRLTPPSRWCSPAGPDSLGSPAAAHALLRIAHSLKEVGSAWRAVHIHISRPVPSPDTFNHSHKLTLLPRSLL